MKKIKKIREITQTIKKIKEELALPLQLLIASEKEVEKEKFVEMLSKNGQRKFFRSLDLEKVEENLKELIKIVKQSDFTILVIDATKFFDEDTVSFAICLKELDAPYLILIDHVKEESEMVPYLERLESLLGIPSSKVILFTEPEDLNKLILLIVDGLERKRLALGKHLPVFRDEVAERIIRKTAWQNGLIGGITILPGADMPFLTANQLKMVLRLASLYGVGIDRTIAKELLAVVGGGFTFRALARQLLNFIPGPGWIIKGGVAFSGTYGMGKAAQLYFKGGKSIGRGFVEEVLKKR